MTARTFSILNLFSYQGISKGLGQLEAYIDTQEGVAFQMDNGLFWDCLGRDFDWPIQGASEKKETSKFYVSHLSSGKVFLSDGNNMFLAPIPPDENPNAYALRPVSTSFPQDPSFNFEVFYVDNKIAFRAYNGRFVARVERGFHSIEAAEYLDDESCLFLPMIGDLHVPIFEILSMTSNDLKEVKCNSRAIMAETFENRSDAPKTHTFTLTWETTVTDRIHWKRLWGCGIPNSQKFKIRGMSITLKYTKDNERFVNVTRNIYEERTMKVVVPAKSKCMARLVANINGTASFSFTTTIRKVSYDGREHYLYHPGAWTGLLYHNIHLDIEIQQYYNPCIIM